MQISSINSLCPNTKPSFKNTTSANQERIKELKQKRVENQWASEGCTGGLSAIDEYELSLREELETLEQKHSEAQSAAEGCNCDICLDEINRMYEIKSILKGLAAKKEENEEPKYSNPIYDIPTGNVYNVPNSTFYGDWAR